LSKGHEPPDSTSKTNTIRINVKKFTPRHIIINLLKTKAKERSRKQPKRNNTLPIPSGEKI